jgi:hypothetical protein
MDVSMEYTKDAIPKDLLLLSDPRVVGNAG